ncbi:ATP-binding cassette domain-containing protein, partial [bacterium]|nr:ATP-binding cassette domain-containing protein [bacterium]
MHIESVLFHAGDFPAKDVYPFNLGALHRAPGITFETAITFFAGENGSGKSTVLKAIARRCGIYIWEEDRERFVVNPHEENLFRYID